MLDSLDKWISIIDIFICILDMGLIVYLFFFRLPKESKKKNNFKKFFRKKNNRVRMLRT